jgi:hypothetical protein
VGDTRTTRKGLLATALLAAVVLALALVALGDSWFHWFPGP